MRVKLRPVTRYPDSKMLANECLARPGEGVKIGSVCCTRDCQCFRGADPEMKFIKCDAKFPGD